MVTKRRCLFPRGRTELTTTVVLTPLVFLLEKILKNLSGTSVAQIYSEKEVTELIMVCLN